MTEESPGPPKVEFDDNAIRDRKHDCLGYWEQAEPLAELLEQVGTPLVVGIDGGWGQGKTSYMWALKGLLEEKGHKTVWCEVWKYSETEEVRKALIRTLYYQLRQDADAAAKLRDWANTAGHILGWTAVRTLEAATGLEGLTKEIDQLLKIDEAFNDIFEQAFTQLVDGYLGRDEEKKLFIFLDDLDRCFGQAPLQILEAVKLYLSVPRVVFVIGADRRALKRAAEQRYSPEGEATGEDERPAEGAATPRLPEKYLEKLIQLPFALPAVTDEGLQRLLKGCRSWATEFAEIEPQTRQKYEELILERTQKNPRNIKRFFMLHQTNCAINPKLKPTKVGKVLALYFWHRDLWDSCHLEPPSLYWLQRQAIGGPYEGPKFPEVDKQAMLKRPLPDEVVALLSLPPHFSGPDDAAQYMTQVSTGEAVPEAEPFDRDELVGNLLSQLPEKRIAAVVRLRAAAKEQVALVCDELIKDLRDEQLDAGWRQAAAIGLGEISQPSDEAVRALIEALGDKDAELRRHAADAIVRIGDDSPAVMDRLRELLDDKEVYVRIEAAYALFKLDDASGLTRILEPLESKSAETRSWAIKRLRGIADVRILKQLIKLLSSEYEDDVRAAAASALGIIGAEAKEAVAPLTEVLRDKDEHAAVRRVAAYALGQIWSHLALEARAEDSEEDKRVRVAARAAIREIREQADKEKGEEEGE